MTRREVLRLLAASTAGAALLHTTQRLGFALTAAANPPSLVWMNDGGDDLNLLPLMGRHAPQFLQLITLQWDLRAFDAVQPTHRNPDAAADGGAPIVVMERIPPAETLDPAAGGPVVERLKAAKAVILLGTEACYGGFTTDPALVARLDATCATVKAPVIRLPGVPTPPHHLVGVLAHLEYFGFPRLDAHGRPLLYYGETVCTACERRADLDGGRFAGAFGQPGCLLRLGCKGIITHNTCSTARWNDGENWCVGAGGPCTGCSEPGFPDHGGIGLYGALTRTPSVASSFWGTVERVGYGLLALSGVGLGLQALAYWLGRRPAPPPPPRAGREEG